MGKKPRIGLRIAGKRVKFRDRKPPKSAKEYLEWLFEFNYRNALRQNKPKGKKATPKEKDKAEIWARSLAPSVKEEMLDFNRLMESLKKKGWITSPRAVLMQRYPQHLVREYLPQFSAKDMLKFIIDVKINAPRTRPQDIAARLEIDIPSVIELFEASKKAKKGIVEHENEFSYHHSPVTKR